MAHITNTRTFEKSAVQQLLIKVFPAMDKSSMYEFIEPSAESQALSEAFGQRCLVSKQMRWHGSLFSQGAIIFIDGSAMEIKACVCIGLDFALLVARLVLLSRSALGAYSRWARTTTIELLPPTGARRAAGWTRFNDNSWLVLQ